MEGGVALARARHHEARVGRGDDVRFVQVPHASEVLVLRSHPSPFAFLETFKNCDEVSMCKSNEKAECVSQMAPGGAVRAAAAAAAAKNKQTDRMVRIEENVPPKSCQALLLFRLMQCPGSGSVRGGGRRRGRRLWRG